MLVMITPLVARREADDYVRHLVVSIACYDKDCAEEYLVGKLAMDQILWSDALADGVPREFLFGELAGAQIVAVQVRAQKPGTGKPGVRASMGGWTPAPWLRAFQLGASYTWVGPPHHLSRGLYRVAEGVR